MSGLDFTAATEAPRAHAAPKPTGTRGRPTTFNVFEGEDVRVIVPTGRAAWALAQLIMAGNDGCTPLTHVGPRWSAYVHKLRTKYSVAIETIDEPHGGEFSGTHARYRLLSRVAFANPADASRHWGDL